MKKIAIVSVFVSISFILNAQVVGTSPVPPAPVETKAVETKAEVLGLQEEVYDFGRIPQGRPVTHIFNIDNIGQDSLKISNVQASCGCTTPEWERNKVQAPGEKTKITVGYNAAAEGPFSKYITITYNGSQTKQVTIKGEVWKTPATSAPENKDLKSLSEE
ncbi:MAG: DUF1573 domain-containing protein [Bacteroidota bacterium]